MTSTLFQHVRIIDPATNTDMIGECLIENGRISQLSDQSSRIPAPKDGHIIDGKGKVLIPGLVDMRVQSCYPGAAHKETPLTLARAAVRGGITSMVCLPNTNPVLDDPQMLKSQCQMLDDLSEPVKSLKLYAYGAATTGLDGESMAELGLLSDAGAVGFTNAIFPINNSLTMRRVLSYAAMLGQPVIQHAEDPVLAIGGEMNEGEHSMRLGLKGIPDAAEEIMIARDLALLRLTGGHYHVAHVATAKGIALIRAAKAEGLRVTCDTAPPYILLNDIAVRDYDSRYRLSPPLRHEDDRRAVLDALADGTIDAVASDHSPQDRDVKSLPFGLAEPGYSGLETLLALMLTLYHGGTLSLMQVIALTSYQPAKLLDLDAGRISIGSPADLALVDIDKSWQIRGDKFASLSSTTPFEGSPVQGIALSTWVNGNKVYEA